MRQFCRAVPKRNVRPLRPYATLASQVQPGETLHGFTVQQVKQVPEFELVAAQLRHDKTGAEHLHITREDKNNVFGIGFGTPSMNSSGIAHILEHTTLCGSNKYPVRDPFFKMLNRSYAHFMNAFTSQDTTFYPFATTNPVDYENLRSVYLDSTLDPLLRELDFRQEGWRLEHVDPRDPTTPIVFKGVVFNEMKGVMSDAGSLYFEDFQKHMYKNTFYGFNSGGNPLDIPTLTYDRLKKFHKEHYHPSNSKTYTYGDIPLTKQLAGLDERFSKFSPLSPEKFSISAPRFTSPQRYETTCPLDPLTDPTKQTVISISFHANELSEGLFDHFALNVLVSLLTDGHSAPLRKALLDTNIGTDWAPNAGHHAFGQTAFVAFGVQGVSDGNESLVESEVLRVLNEVAEQGIETGRIEGVLHQLELSLKHKSADFGTSLMWKTMDSWFDGVSPIEQLQWTSRIERLKNEISKGPFFQNLVRKYFLENQSRLILTMRPDEKFDEKFKSKEKALLSERVESLSESDKKKIAEEGLALLAAQEKPDDISSLPTLTVDDIPVNGETHATEKETIDNVPVQWRIAPTNGITYFTATSSLSGLPGHLKPYVPLFADALSSLGTKTKTASEFEDEINLKTDGLRGNVSISANHSDLGKSQESLVVTTACLDKNVPAMYDLIRQFMLETNWDNEQKLNSLIKNSASGVVNSIASAGSRFAALYAASKHTPSKAASEVAGGMTQIRMLSQMARWEEYTELIAILKQIASFMFSRQSLRVAVICGQEIQSENRTATSELLGKLPDFEVSLRQNPFPIGKLPSRAFFTLPYSVNYAALSLKGVPYTHSDSPVLRILANYIEQKRIHPEVREKGGAYGGGARYDSLEGIFAFTSYRDPSFERSLEVMREAGRWTTEQKFEDDVLGEMKLSTFKDIDAPISVQQEGMLEFMYGITDDLRQRWRERALSVTADQVREAAQKYLVQPSTKGLTSEAVLGEINQSIMESATWEKFDFNTAVAGDEGEEASEAAAA